MSLLRSLYSLLGEPRCERYGLALEHFIESLCGQNTLGTNHQVALFRATELFGDPGRRHSKSMGSPADRTNIIAELRPRGCSMLH